MRSLIVIAAALFLFSASGHANPLFTDIVAFGDSLSDGGNVYYLTSTNPAYHPDPPPSLGSPSFSAYYNGRTTNGPNWVDQLADKLSLPRPQASLTGGTDYAYASAQSGPGTSVRYPSPTYPPNPPLTVPNVGAQIQAFAAARGTFQPTDLVTLWVGADDLLKGATSASAIVGVVNNIVADIRSLNGLGANTIIVPNQIDFSLTPTSRLPGNPPPSAFRALSIFFDTTLATALNGLQADPTISARIVPVDIFSAAEAVAANPAAFGFTNITDPALTFDPTTETFSEVPDVNDYLWYDSIHPTSLGEAIATDAAFTALVPCPPSLWLFLPSVTALLLVTRARKQGQARGLGLTG
jgi:outer membrane lipase/esterase